MMVLVTDDERPLVRGWVPGGGGVLSVWRCTIRVLILAGNGYM